MMLTLTLDDVSTDHLEHVLVAAAREHPDVITVERSHTWPEDTYRVHAAGISMRGVLTMRAATTPTDTEQPASADA